MLDLLCTEQLALCGWLENIVWLKEWILLNMKQVRIDFLELQNLSSKESGLIVKNGFNSLIRKVMPKLDMPVDLSQVNVGDLIRDLEKGFNPL